MKALFANYTFLRFCCVGGTATLIQYVVMIALVQLAGRNPTLASGVGYGLASIFNYLATRRFVFASDRSHTTAGSRYIAMIFSGLLLNTLFMAVLQHFGLHYLVSQILTTLAVLVYNFLMASHWVFGGPTKEPAGP